MAADASFTSLKRNLMMVAKRQGVPCSERARMRQDAAATWKSMIAAGTPAHLILVRVLRGSSGRFRVEWFTRHADASPDDLAFLLSDLGDCANGIFRPLPADAGPSGPLN